MLITKEQVTLLVPTRAPYIFGKEFEGWKTLNPVQVVDKHEEMHFAFCKAIELVTTPFFTFVDDDDPFPSYPETIEDVGITFGDNYINQRGHTCGYAFKGWTFKEHMKNSTLIHRAICKTEDAQRILRPVAREPIYTEHWLYAHLAKESGYYYDNSYVAIWNKKNTGLHTKVRQVIENTQALFKKHYPQYV